MFLKTDEESNNVRSNKWKTKKSCIVLQIKYVINVKMSVCNKTIIK